MNLNEKDVGKLLIITKKINKDKVVKYTGYLIKLEKDFIILKLKDNGYNIGISLTNDLLIEKKEDSIKVGKIGSVSLKQNKNLPNVAYIGTGGTISTHVDYNIGGVFMCRTPEEIVSTTPELIDIINFYNLESPVLKASEDLTYKDWQKISEVVYNQLIDENVNGILISHGTDTLCWTGTAISFMIENINKPILLIGAQKSPDRASFDGSLNLICAAHFVKEKINGVFTVMHGSINDDFCYVIRATKAKKLHSSRRDAFKAINDKPIAKVYYDGKIEYLISKKELLKKEINKPKLNVSYEEKVAIIKAHPNSNPEVINWYIENNYKGLVIVGTGLGHMPINTGIKDRNWLPFIKKAIDKGIIVIMCTDTVFGKVNDSVYVNLREIKNIGVLYVNEHDMLPEVVFIKLCVALGRFKKLEDIKNYLETPIAEELTSKELVCFFNFIDYE